MPAYAYKAMNGAGRVLSGRMDAVNPVDLEMRLKRMGLDFIDGAPIRHKIVLGGRIPRRELIHFCFHLEQLARAGIPLTACLTDLRDSVAHPQLRAVLADMVESVGGGKPLSQAMAAHPHAFDDVMVSLIRAGEDSGMLPEVLADLLESLKWQDELSAHTRKLAAYPAFLGAITLGLLAFMLTYFVPKMAAFTMGTGQKLPVQTERLLALSGFVTDHWSILLILPAAIAAAFSGLVRAHPRIRRLYDGIKLRIPVLGGILRNATLARFAGVFGMMYGAGISVLDAIAATEKVVGNTAVAASLRQVGRLIEDGESLAAAFDKVGLFPPLVIRMLRIGEHTGALDRALGNVRYFYHRDVRESVERIQVLIEPALTVIIGGLMSWVMLAALAPIYDVIVKLGA